jgi:hypothetical protein
VNHVSKSCRTRAESVTASESKPCGCSRHMCRDKPGMKPKAQTVVMPSHCIDRPFHKAQALAFGKNARAVHGPLGDAAAMPAHLQLGPQRHCDRHLIPYILVQAPPQVADGMAPVCGRVIRCAGKVYSHVRPLLWPLWRGLYQTRGNKGHHIAKTTTGTSAVYGLLTHASQPERQRLPGRLRPEIMEWDSIYGHHIGSECPIMRAQ